MYTCKSAQKIIFYFCAVFIFLGAFMTKFVMFPQYVIILEIVKFNLASRIEHPKYFLEATN